MLLTGELEFAGENMGGLLKTGIKITFGHNRPDTVETLGFNGLFHGD